MIFIRLAGGLGNQLFQLAAALHVQAKTNMPISFFTHHLKNYETPREFMLQEILPKEFPLQFLSPKKSVQFILKYRINKALPFLFKWSITTNNISNFKKSKFYILDDYFQDISIFKQQLNVVAQYINNAANRNNKVGDICSTHDQFKNTIAIHIRRGDFLNKSNANTFCLQNNSYYKQNILSNSNITKVYIFSETEVKDIKEITDLPTFWINELNLTDVEEFLLMTKFNNLIIANSTYSFWAAVAAKYNNAKSTIIAPLNWFYNTTQNNTWISNLKIAELKAC